MITAGGLLWTFRVWCRGHHRAGKRFERCCLDFSKSKNFGQVRTELFRQGLIKMASAAVDADHFGLVGSLETDGAESEAKSKNGVSLKKTCPPNKSMRSAPIKAMPPLRQVYSSFFNMSDSGRLLSNYGNASGPLSQRIPGQTIQSIALVRLLLGECISQHSCIPAEALPKTRN